jgi:hypothetical protein
MTTLNQDCSCELGKEHCAKCEYDPRERSLRQDAGRAGQNYSSIWLNVCFELRSRPSQRLKIQLEKQIYLPYHFSKTVHRGKSVLHINKIWRKSNGRISASLLYVVKRNFKRRQRQMCHACNLCSGESLTSQRTGAMDLLPNEFWSKQV